MTNCPDCDDQLLRDVDFDVLVCPSCHWHEGGEWETQDIDNPDDATIDYYYEKRWLRADERIYWTPTFEDYDDET